MESLWIQAVVKNGQVVLETPLDLPDGTVVTVEYDPEGQPKEEKPHDPKAAMWAFLKMIGRTDLFGDPLAAEKLRSGR